MTIKGVTMKVLTGLILAVALFLSVPVSAQTYLTSTTNTNAVTASQTTWVVGSNTGMAVGGALYVNREYVTITAVTGTTGVTVRRGQVGTVANAHGASQTVIIIPVAAVPTVTTNIDPTPIDGVGTCTLTAHQYLPIINVISGNIWLCRYTAAAQTSRVWAATNQTLVTYNSILINLS